MEGLSSDDDGPSPEAPSALVARVAVEQPVRESERATMATAVPGGVGNSHIIEDREGSLDALFVNDEEDAGRANTPDADAPRSSGSQEHKGVAPGPLMTPDRPDGEPNDADGKGGAEGMFEDHAGPDDDFQRDLAPLGPPQPQAQQRMRSDAETWELPLVDCDDRDVHLLTFKAMLDIEQPEYNRRDFTLEEVVEFGDDGRLVQRAPHANRIRWRVVDVGGQDALESNARIVRWDDGSMSLFLGSECVDIAVAPLQERHLLLGVLHEAQCVVQGHGLITKRLQLNPPPVGSQLQRNLQAASSPSKEGGRIKYTKALTNFSKEHDDAVLRDHEAAKLNKRQDRVGKRRVNALFNITRVLDANRPRVTEADLEAESDDDFHQDPEAAAAAEEEGARRLLATKRANEAAAKRTRMMVLDDDEDVVLSSDDEQGSRGARGHDQPVRTVLDDDDE